MNVGSADNDEGRGGGGEVEGGEGEAGGDFVGGEFNRVDFWGRVRMGGKKEKKRERKMT